MFGLGRNTSYSRGNMGGGSKLRGALLAGAGLLAYRWWQNRQSSRSTASRGTDGSTRSTAWSPGQQTGGFAAGGTTPGGSAF